MNEKLTRRERYKEIFQRFDTANAGLTKKDLIRGEIEVFGYNSSILRKEFIASGQVVVRSNGTEEKYYSNF